MRKLPWSCFWFPDHQIFKNPRCLKECGTTGGRELGIRTPIRTSMGGSWHYWADNDIVASFQHLPEFPASCDSVVSGLLSALMRNQNAQNLAGNSNMPQKLKTETPSSRLPPHAAVVEVRD